MLLYSSVLRFCELSISEGDSLAKSLSPTISKRFLLGIQCDVE